MDAIANSIENERHLLQLEILLHKYSDSLDIQEFLIISTDEC